MTDDKLFTDSTKRFRWLVLINYVDQQDLKT